MQDHLVVHLSLLIDSSNSDFVFVSLNENDVPGVKLSYSLIEKHSNNELKRWLSCRELKVGGNKKKLVDSLSFKQRIIEK